MLSVNSISPLEDISFSTTLDLKKCKLHPLKNLRIIKQKPKLPKEVEYPTNRLVLAYLTNTNSLSLFITYKACCHNFRHWSSILDGFQNFSIFCQGLLVIWLFSKHFRIIIVIVSNWFSVRLQPSLQSRPILSSSTWGCYVYYCIAQFISKHSINCQLKSGISLQLLVGSVPNFKLRLLWPRQTFQMF